MEKFHLVATDEIIQSAFNFKLNSRRYNRIVQQYPVAASCSFKIIILYMNKIRTSLRLDVKFECSEITVTISAVIRDIV